MDILKIQPALLLTTSVFFHLPLAAFTDVLNAQLYILIGSFILQKPKRKAVLHTDHLIPSHSTYLKV